MVQALAILAIFSLIISAADSIGELSEQEHVLRVNDAMSVRNVRSSLNFRHSRARRISSSKQWQAEKPQLTIQPKSCCDSENLLEEKPIATEPKRLEMLNGPFSMIDDLDDNRASLKTLKSSELVESSDRTVEPMNVGNDASELAENDFSPKNQDADVQSLRLKQSMLDMVSISPLEESGYPSQAKDVHPENWEKQRLIFAANDRFDALSPVQIAQKPYDGLKDVFPDDSDPMELPGSNSQGHVSEHSTRQETSNQPIASPSECFKHLGSEIFSEPVEKQKALVFQSWEDSENVADHQNEEGIESLFQPIKLLTIVI